MKVNSGKIIFAGGGTGGHVYPAIASIESLASRGDFRILYVGGYDGIENRIIPPLNISFKKIWITGFQRYLTLRNILFPLKLVVSLWQSLFIILLFKPDVVVGTGGYVSGPVVYCAAKLGIPTLIQEQDYYPGVTTRILAKYADIICIPHPGVEKHFTKVKGQIILTGNPIRNSLRLIDKKEAVACFGLDAQRPVIFIFGGSQGAQSINYVIPDIAKKLIESYNVQFLWQTGVRNYREVSQTEITSWENVKILDYIDNMGIAYSAADIIVSRAGAITLAELAKVGRACVLVPYPHAAANHQTKNARAVAEAGAALVVLEDENFKNNLLKAIENIIIDQIPAKKMKAAWQKIYKSNAADLIVDAILRIMRKNV
jgi:UDP-N-acetylglucosamine--N-acetylmuramyl-(pentapeptide) pyrophosphoryl-undecaprenol N-acetylglucosamine transferase